MSQWILQEIAKVQGVVMAGIVAAAGAIIGHSWIKHRSVVRVLSSMILAGAVVWGAANVSWFRDKIQSETGMGARPPAAVVMRASALVLPVT